MVTVIRSANTGIFDPSCSVQINRCGVPHGDNNSFAFAVCSVDSVTSDKIPKAILFGVLFHLFREGGFVGRDDMDAVGDDGKAVKLREHTGITETEYCCGETENGDNDCGKRAAGHGCCTFVVCIPAGDDKKSGHTSHQEK